MSKHATPFLVPPLQTDPQLQRLNEKISKLAAVKPAADVFGAFGLAAHLSGLAIEAALELGQLPGVDMKTFEPTIKFWELVRDQSSISPKTFHEYGINIKTLSAFFGAFRLQEISADQIRAYQQMRRAKCGPP